MDIEILGVVYEIGAPLCRRRAAPGCYGTVEKRQSSIRYHKIFGDIESTSEAFTHGACAHRIVEVEHLLRHLGKGNTIGLKSLRERMSYHLAFRSPDYKRTLVVPLEEGSLRRVGKARDFVAAVVHREAVDEQFGHDTRRGIIL